MSRIGPVFAVCLLAIPVRAGTDAESDGVVRHHRVICIRHESPLGTDATNETRTVPFGTLLKVSEVNGDRCLVWNSFTVGWIDRDRIMSLSDPALLETLKHAKVPPAVREYAIGNYFIRRDLNQARIHFERAISLDQALDYAYVDYLFLVSQLGDNAAVDASLKELERFRNREDVVLSFAIRSNGTPELFRRCSEVMENSSYLRYAVAAFLLQQNDARLLVSARELAEEAFRQQPGNPVRAFLTSRIFLAMADQVEERDLKLTMHEACIDWLVRATAADHCYWRGYEDLAFLFSMQKKRGEAVRLAQAALRVNPRAVIAAEIIASYEHAVSGGAVLRDATGTKIPREEFLGMPEVCRGLRMIDDLDLPLRALGKDDEDLQLHGYTGVSIGKEQTVHGSTALHLLTEDHNGACLKYLAQHFHLDWDQADAEGKSPLQIAVEAGDLPLTALIIDSGADVNSSSDSVRSPVELAIDLEHTPIVHRLLTSRRVSQSGLHHVREYLGTEQDTSTDELIGISRSRVTDQITHFVNTVLQQLCRQHREMLLVVESKREKELSRDLLIPVSNAPILIPSELAHDARQFPGQTNVYIWGRIVEEVDEMLARRSLNDFHRDSELDSAIIHTEDLRKKAVEVADLAMAVAYSSLDTSDYHAFTATTGPRITRAMQASQIRWKNPFPDK